MGKIKSYRHEHPFLFYLTCFVLVIVIDIIVNAIIVIVRYWPKVAALLMALVVAFLPAIPGMVASVNAQLDTNVYAAVFAVSSSPAVTTNLPASFPVVAYTVYTDACTNGVVATPDFNGITLSSTAGAVDSDTLNNTLKQQYGVELPKFGSSAGKYSSYGLNGVSVTNIPSIAFDRTTGQITVSNSTAQTYTVVCMRKGLSSDDQWMPVCTVAAPAGNTIVISDYNEAPTDGALYMGQIVNAPPQIVNGVVGKSVTGARPEAVLDVVMAIMVIVVGTIVFIYLYKLCLKLFPPPPPPPKTTNNPPPKIVLPGIQLKPGFVVKTVNTSN